MNLNTNYSLNPKAAKQNDTIDRSRTHDGRNSEIFHLDDLNNPIITDDDYTTMTMYK